MTSTPDAPSGEDLAALRAEIDELQAIPEEELVSPTPSSLIDREPEAEPTDAIGSEKWNRPVDEESLDQE
jgi:hypothetical protein